MSNAKHQAGLAARILFAGAIIVCAALPLSAQRGRPSGGDGGGSRGSDSTPRRESSPPQRESSRSERSEPPQRSERSERSEPRRESSPPPQRSERSEPRRESSPPPRRDSDSSSRGDYESPRRRDDSSSPRREDSSSRRDSAPERRPSDSDRSPRSSSDSSPQRDNPAPRRDPSPGSSDRTSSDSSRPTRNPDIGRNDSRRDNIDDTGNNPLNRRNPSTSPDRYRDTFEPGRSRHPDSRNDDTVRYRGSDSRPNRGHDVFTRSAEGRRYNSGIVLREGYRFSNPRLRTYFSHGYSYFPYYCPTYDAALVFYSPYSYYYGCYPSYIYRHRTYYRRPAIIYIEVPIYTGNDCRGYDSDLDDYYLNRSHYDLDDRDRDLRQATDALREAFRYGSIEPLVEITDPGVRIAIFRKGNYEYSVEPNDFLDMTRDAMRATDTISFDLYRFKRRATGVYVISGKHVYRNREGERRTVYVSYVVERLNSRWVLTQVGTAPDRIQEPR